jgi:hypothetical protein
MWVISSREERGAMKDKIWLRNTNTNERALFKPDTEDESARSLVFYKVCTHLGIDCAKTELFEFESKKGCLSYDVGHIRFIADEGADLDIKSGSSYKQGSKDISYTDLEKKLTERVKIKFADMVYVDVLLRNTDRHSGNFKLLLDKRGNIVDLLGLYDNDEILRERHSELSIFRWDTEVAELLYDVIKKPYADFPGRIEELITKTANLPRTIDFYDKIMQRFIQIKEIFNLRI